MKFNKAGKVIMTACFNILLSGLAVLLLFCLPSWADPLYSIEKHISLPGDKGWDLLALDEVAGRLYVSRGTEVQVVDVAEGKVVGKVSDTAGVHGVALATDLGKGYTSNGLSGTATVFDLKTLEPLSQIVVGEKPDVILYDRRSHRVFVFNAKSQDVSIIDAKKDTVIKTLPLQGKPELAVSDERGKIFVNLEDKSSVAVIDVKKMKVRAVWPLVPGTGPTGLAIDRKHHLLFSVCDNQKMEVVDFIRGEVVADLVIGKGPDGAGFDPGTMLAFSSNGEGSLSVIHEKSKRKFDVLDTVSTQRGARTMVLNTKDHRIYLIGAQYGPTPTPAPGKEHARPPIIPGSVEVLVLKYK